MQPNCANVDEIITTKITSTYYKNKQSTPKDNGKSQSKATSTVSMKQIATGKPGTKPNGAERLSYYDR